MALAPSRPRPEARTPTWLGRSSAECSSRACNRFDQRGDLFVAVLDERHCGSGLENLLAHHIAKVGSTERRPSIDVYLIAALSRYRCSRAHGPGPRLTAGRVPTMSAIVLVGRVDRIDFGSWRGQIQVRRGLTATRFEAR
jgi:hypothetical protein